jgi:dolichol kinase
MFPPVNGKKSWEGTCGNLVVSFMTGMILLYLYCHYPLGRSFAASLTGAAAGAFTELISSSEWDTVTVPAVILAVMLVML